MSKDVKHMTWEESIQRLSDVDVRRLFHAAAQRRDAVGEPENAGWNAVMFSLYQEIQRRGDAPGVEDIFPPMDLE